MKKIFLLAAIIFSLSYNAAACTVSITVSPNDTVCSGVPVTFNATVTVTCAAFYMDWYLNGNIVLSAGPIATAVPYTLNSPVSGDQVYCFVACNPFDMCTSNTIVMNVLPPVIPSVVITASPDTICLPGCITFTATVVNGGSSPAFQWYEDGFPTATSTTWVACNLTPGTHSVSFNLTSSDTCANPNPVLSNSVTVVVLICTGIEENVLNSSLLISPNPNDGIFTVHFNSYSSFIYHTVTNPLGEIIHEQNLPAGQAGIMPAKQCSVDVKDFPAGVYFVTVTDEKKNSVTKKFVKM